MLLKPPGRQSGASGTVTEVFCAFLKLGCTSFGGPIAHLGYFRSELVVRRKWLDDAAYGELVGLCQFLPGPASSQVGFAMGLLRAGPFGGLAAWTAFTLPSALIMLLVARLAADLSGPIAAATIHGLKIAAVAIVAQALFGMARALTPDLRRITIACVAAAITLAVALPPAQIAIIVFGGVAGLALCPIRTLMPATATGWTTGRLVGLSCLAVFGLLFLPMLVTAPRENLLALAGIFYRAGALVFGGGHVVLPLLHAELVPDWMDDSAFLTGYGAAQAIPGPLFTFSAYLGAVALPETPLAGAAIALLASFMPGLLIVAAALPFRATIASHRRAQSAIAGINASVVGILAAALYDPLWKSGVESLMDGSIAVACVVLLTCFRAPPIAIVGLAVAVSVALAAADNL
jgi:chromate transporter